MLGLYLVSSLLVRCLGIVQVAKSFHLSINDVSERARRSDDGKGSSNFGDSELVKTVGMRDDGCSVTGCMVERNSSDSNEAVEG